MILLLSYNLLSRTTSQPVATVSKLQKKSALPTTLEEGTVEETHQPKKGQGLVRYSMY